MFVPRGHCQWREELRDYEAAKAGEAFDASHIGINVIMATLQPLSFPTAA